MFMCNGTKYPSEKMVSINSTNWPHRKYTVELVETGNVFVSREKRQLGDFWAQSHWVTLRRATHNLVDGMACLPGIEQMGCQGNGLLSSSP